MRMRSIIPISLVMLAACGPARHQAVRTQTLPAKTTVTVIEPPVTPQPAYTAFPSLENAVASILASSPQVVAFGEIHKTHVSNLTSTMQYFAREVMPLLVEQGITDLVWEHLPSGETARAEIAAYGESQQLGPFLTQWFAYNADRPGILEVIRQANDLGITLHGCHAVSAQEYHANMINMGELINERLLSRVRALVAEGRRVAVYAGTQHNDRIPVAGFDHVSIGDEMRVELGDQYVEVDIYPASFIRPEFVSILGIEGWESFIPDQGANLVSRPGGRRIIFLPASAQ